MMSRSVFVVNRCGYPRHNHQFATKRRAGQRMVSGIREFLSSPLRWTTILCIAAGNGCYPTPAFDTVEVRNAGSSTIFQFGTLAKGATAVRELMIVNRTGGPWDIRQIGASCDCVRLSAVPTVVPADDSFFTEVRLDLTEDPEFVGGLAPELVARDANGIELFVIVIRAKIEARSEDDLVAPTAGG